MMVSKINIILKQLIKSFFKRIIYIFNTPISKFYGNYFEFMPLPNNKFSIKSKNNLLKNKKSIRIPRFYKGKIVTQISDGGFADFNFKKIIMPNTIKYIGPFAFKNCNNLKKIIYKRRNIKMIFMFNDVPVFNGVGLCCDKYSFINNSVPKFYTNDKRDGTGFELIIPDQSFFDCVQYNIGHDKESDYRVKGQFNIVKQKRKYDIKSSIYGKLLDVRFALIKNGKVINSFVASYIVCTSPIYNFAYIVGNYASLFFTLKCKEITDSGRIPTFLIGTINNFNLSQLAFNIKNIPLKQQCKTAFNNLNASKTVMAKYIKELYDLNNLSFFNIFLTDCRFDILFEIMYSNHISDKNFKCTLIKEGNGIIQNISNFYKIICSDWLSNSKKVNEELLALESCCLKSDFWNKNKVKEMLTFKFQIDYYFMLYYPYFYSRVKNNFKYLCGAKFTSEDLLGVDKNFCEYIKSSLIFEDEYLKLDGFNANDLAQINTMLYVPKALTKNPSKKTIIIIGAHWKFEKENFYELLKLTIDFFGKDKYFYMYKPHVGYSSTIIKEKIRIFKRLKKEGYYIEEILNYFPAEMIINFENVYFVGWASTFFESIKNNSLLLMLYDNNFVGSSLYKNRFSYFCSCAKNTNGSKCFTIVSNSNKKIHNVNKIYTFTYK